MLRASLNPSVGKLTVLPRLWACDLARFLNLQSWGPDLVIGKCSQQSQTRLSRTLREGAPWEHNCKQASATLLGLGRLSSKTLTKQLSRTLTLTKCLLLQDSQWFGFWTRNPGGDSNSRRPRPAQPWVPTKAVRLDHCAVSM